MMTFKEEILNQSRIINKIFDREIEKNPYYLKEIERKRLG